MDANKAFQMIEKAFSDKRHKVDEIERKRREAFEKEMEKA